MSDRFDKAMQEIAIASGKNGGPTISDVLKALQASHEDSVESAQLLAQKVEDASKARRLEREELHTWEMAQAARCATEHKRLFEEEFERVTARSPHRKDDPPDANFAGDAVALAFAGDYDREKYDRGVRQRLMTATTRYIVIAIVIILLASLAYALFAHHDDLQADLATGLSSTIAVVMLIWAMMRKGR